MDQPKKEKVKRPDTPLADSPTPDYSNMKTTKRTWFKDKEYTPTAQDTIEYKEGFSRGVEGKNKFFPSKVSVHGYNEAKARNLLAKQNKK
jgi:hypothetical protein